MSRGISDCQKSGGLLALSGQGSGMLINTLQHTGQFSLYPPINNLPGPTCKYCQDEKHYNLNFIEMPIILIFISNNISLHYKFKAHDYHSNCVSISRGSSLDNGDAYRITFDK